MHKNDKLYFRWTTKHNDNCEHKIFYVSAGTFFTTTWNLELLFSEFKVFKYCFLS
jgi:hypothetical protein